MRSWHAVVLGIGCFLLASWNSTSIVLGDDGHVLILNADTEKLVNSKCAAKNSCLEKLCGVTARPFTIS